MYWHPEISLPSQFHYLELCQKNYLSKYAFRELNSNVKFCKPSEDLYKSSKYLRLNVRTKLSPLVVESSPCGLGPCLSHSVSSSLCWPWHREGDEGEWNEWFDFCLCIRAQRCADFLGLFHLDSPFTLQPDSFPPGEVNVLSSSAHMPRPWRGVAQQTRLLDQLPCKMMVKQEGNLFSGCLHQEEQRSQWPKICLRGTHNSLEVK